MSYVRGTLGGENKGKKSDIRSGLMVTITFLRRPLIQHKDQYHITELAQYYWGSDVSTEHVVDAGLVEGVYDAMLKAEFQTRLVTELELSHYLEKYLWPKFDPLIVTKHYLLSIVLLVNEKYKQRVSAWKIFQTLPEQFATFFKMVMETLLTTLQSTEYTMKERIILLVFLIHCVNSLEIDLVRDQVQKLFSLNIWSNLLPNRLEQELSRSARLRKFWTTIQRKTKQLDADLQKRRSFEQSFMFNLINLFLQVLNDISCHDDIISTHNIHYCERMLELLIDIQAQLSTRRFFNALLDDMHLIAHCQHSKLSQMEPEGHLFNQLCSRLQFYAVFEINDQSGEALTEHEMMDFHYNCIKSLQLAAFKSFPGLRKFALSTVASVDTEEALYSHFQKLSPGMLQKIAAHLNLTAPCQSSLTTPLDPALLLDVIVSKHRRRKSQLETLNSTPLYPTEDVLWDESIVPNEYYDYQGCFALPKLNLQFLTLHDYLYRNFTLFQLESTYEIRQNIEDIITRMRPWVNPDGDTLFAGWARMAQCISAFSIVEVGKPKVGENRPSRVRADVTIDVKLKDFVRQEWEALRKHDVCFLLSVKAKMSLHDHYDYSKPFPERVGLSCVRGCEVEGMLDSEGKVIEDGSEHKPEVKGNTRTFRVWLDTNQYQNDMQDVVRGGEDVYETFNIFMRRKPKENNFKAVLETIRCLINEDCVVPLWLQNIILGYGDSSAAHCTRLSGQLHSLDFYDTFLSLDHLVQSFPDYKVECSVIDPEKLVPPFRVVFHEENHTNSLSGSVPMTSVECEKERPLVVSPYTVPSRGPYPFNQPKRNVVPFVPTQVEAIKAGMQHGLTLIVGPPGTGKTDVAVQIISNLYHNFPEQRTLLVTHSNQALNQLFEKIIALDIDERHLLRLGHGEEELQSDKDFSRYGRVNFILALRLELLKEVERLQSTLGVCGDVSYTCETATYFYHYQVLPRWETYCSKMTKLANKVAAVAQHFPFVLFFSDAPQPLFKGQNFTEDLEIAEGCFRYIEKVFKQLEEFRPFELLRSSRDRVNYLLVKEAKIIALTCTHAALKRKELIDLSFKYDNVLMEEAAQILEIETFIPLMLQTPQDGHCRLKRVVLIGDHHQLPPVIQNMTFQKFSNMEQSLFARFVRLGVPQIQLDAQGRSRPSLCSLYKWCYKTLGDLPHVLSSPEYLQANAGFQFDFQLVNVDDFNGVGETTPTPFFYQNLAEAEFAVALFMYMRLQGYPPDKITILTTYNGQKHLIRDVLQKRCSNNPVFGIPEKVTTVDRYQGQQNDYIILSLVRTKDVGHLRDVRRLVVSVSRARLGLYILARVSLFKKCKEIQPAIDIMIQRPLNLHLIPNEFYPTSRALSASATSPVLIVTGMVHLANLVYQEYSKRIAAVQYAHHNLEPPPVEDTNTTCVQEGEKVAKETIHTVVGEEVETVKCERHGSFQAEKNVKSVQRMGLGSLGECVISDESYSQAPTEVEKLVGSE